MATRLRNKNNTSPNYNQIFSAIINNVTQDPSQDKQLLIDILKPVRISKNGDYATDSDNNWKYSELLDIRFKNNNNSNYSYPIIAINTTFDGVNNNTPNILDIRTEWVSNSVTTHAFIGIATHTIINSASGLGRVHDASGISGELQIVKGYAYSNGQGIKSLLDIRTTGNGKMSSSYASVYLDPSGGCTELYGLFIKDDGSTGLVSTGRKRAISLQGADFIERFYVSLDGKSLKLTPSSPLSSSDTGNIGDIKIDDSYIYICTSANNWKRATLNSF